MRLALVAERVANGETVSFKATGNSMTPRILNGETVTVAPYRHTPMRVGDIALAKVRGRWYLHNISGLQQQKGKQMVQISNNHGHVNGWTPAANVIGRVE